MTYIIKVNQIISAESIKQNDESFFKNITNDDFMNKFIDIKIAWGLVFYRYS